MNTQKPILIDGKEYVLVPVEPTDSMFFDPDEVCTNYKETPWSAFCRIYKSMLDAAIAQQKGQP